jgi:hypothetical protein
MPQEMPRQTSTPHPIQYNKENINEPFSFESLDSKSKMLLINLPLGKIDNEPGEKVLTFSSARLSKKSLDFSDKEPHQAKLDELPRTALLCNEPGEKVKTFSSARLSEKPLDFSDKEPHQAKLDELLNNFPSGKIVNEPGEKVKTFSSAMMINKRTKPYIITKKIVYESCAIGCKWNMIYK